MAGKLLKHFGLGRKTPPHPPKADYTTQKSTSVQELLPKSPPSERSTVSLSATTSHIGDLDRTGSGSPAHKTSDKSLFGGARPKDSGSSSGFSPKQSVSERHSIISIGGEDGAVGGQGSEGADGAAKSKKPQLLDEYSDPFDLKKQIEDNPDLAGACAPTPVTDDDYSVPYEVKKLMREIKLREAGERVNKKTTRPYEDPYSEGPMGQIGASGTDSTNGQDLRPKEDYDEPWEWSAKQIFNVTQLQDNPSGPKPGAQSATPLMTKRTTQPGQPAATIVVEATPSANGASPKLAQSEDYENAPEKLQQQKQQQKQGGLPVPEDEDDEGYTHLRDFGLDRLSGAAGPCSAAPPTATTTATTTTTTTSQPTATTTNNSTPPLATKRDTAPPPKDVKYGNYEEPWDLTSTQKDLEDKLREASDRASRERGEGSPGSSAVSTPPGTVKPQENGASIDSAPLVDTADTFPHESDTRSQEGYEKPWDWKPHKKDERGQEGYEKPWDWKPHQKDDRPTEEYEEPWDQKTKGIERDLIKAKSAKEAGGMVHTTDPSDDPRPMEEYDEPWESKLKNKNLMPRAGSNKSAGASGGPQSPKKKKNLNLDLVWNNMGLAERIDPKLPLDQQGWYHGKISRVDAEKLLRVHKEGSYLVRMSESNKQDYSLSLKSAKGFMHMKIVSRDNKFILGQFSQPFDSIPRMIHHYSISKLPIKGAEHMSLLHPVNHELL